MDVVARVFDPSVLAQAIGWDMPSFLRAYTLHDSALEEFRHSPSVGVAIVINWDLHWNRNIPHDYRWLAIVFPLPYSLTWTQGSWHYSTLEGAASEFVSAADRERMLADGSVELQAFRNQRDEIQPCVFDESLTRTVFQGMNWSRITILHNEEVRFLCFDDLGSLFAIPKVAPESRAAPDSGGIP